MAITRTQNSTIATSTGGTTVAPAWPAATTAGALLVAIVGTSGVNTAGTITAPGAPDWTLAHSHYPGANAPKLWVYYIQNADSRSSTETFTNSQTDDLWAVLIEYASAATSTVLDVVAENGSATGATTGDSGTTATTAQADEVWVAAIADRNLSNFSAPTNSFALVDQGNTGNATTSDAIDTCWLERIVSATGAANTSVTQTSRPWAGIIVTFKAAAGGEPTPAVEGLRLRMLMGVGL